MATMTKTTNATNRRLPANFDDTLYSYVRKGNANWARNHGTKEFGSQSAYVDYLISKDRGIAPQFAAKKTAAKTKTSSVNKKKKVTKTKKAH